MNDTALKTQMRDTIDEYLRVREQTMLFENQHRDILDKHRDLTERANHLSRHFAPGDDGLPQLSRRQLQVLELVAAGHTNEEAGQRLFISAETVRTHVRQAIERLGVSNRVSAVAEAMRRGLIT